MTLGLWNASFRGVVPKTPYSNGGSWQKLKAYLGKCIDNGWADGREPDLDQGSQVDIAAVKEQFRRMKTENLKFWADAGNQFTVAELKRR